MVTCSRHGWSVVIAALFTLVHSTVGPAQERDTVRKTLRAFPRTSPIHVDGRLSESDWSRAAVASDFLQREPEPNEPASQVTEVRVLVDEGALYVGARLFDTEPMRIAAQLGRRDPDDLFTDAFHVAIDSYFDRRTAFRFSVSPAGVQSDAIHFNDTDDDDNWDAVFESAATIDSGGWTAELRIPLSQLRYGHLPPGETRRWGIQFAREIARLGEESHWAPMPPTQRGIVSRFGDLIGIDSLGVPARLEVLPYVSSQLTRLPSGETNALVDATNTSARAGVDIRYGL
ncbi:MAG: carbohydrate binding family 9 domain-containing protein, partial [Gemmatimonadaceae bacterium]